MPRRLLSEVRTAALSVTPAQLTFTQPQGGAAPAAQTINITSTGSILSYTVTPSIQSGGNWLSVSPSSGITPGQVGVVDESQYA
jgi:hypothetical protein